jgi:hypothetical protein
LKQHTWVSSRLQIHPSLTFNCAIRVQGVSNHAWIVIPTKNQLGSKKGGVGLTRPSFVLPAEKLRGPLVNELDLQPVVFFHSDLSRRLHRKDRTWSVSNYPFSIASAKNVFQSPSFTRHYNQIALLFLGSGDGFLDNFAKFYERSDL